MKQDRQQLLCAVINIREQLWTFEQGYLVSKKTSLGKEKTEKKECQEGWKTDDFFE